MTFLKTPPTSDGDSVPAKVVRQIMDCDTENHSQIKFLLSLGDGELEELISYNKLCDLITDQMVPKAEGYGEMHTFKRILDHQGPLKRHDPKYKDSQWNVLVAWDDGTHTWEPLNIIGKCDEITLAKYAKDNDLLSKPGWKFLRNVEKSVFSIWVDLLLCRSIQLLVLSYAEMFVYMYLSQLMSTFTNYLKVHHLLDGFFIL